MKIKKLLIQNFKGVHEPHVLEFDKPYSILQGPNGFGKTTIYDAIELSVTGMLHRTMKMGHVTKDIKDYADAFYRNTKNEDVVIRLLIERPDGEQKVIVKRLAYNDSGVSDKTGARGIKYKATNWDNIQTFLLEPDDFDNNDYDLMDSATQDTIEEWYFVGEKRSLKRLYRLFAYLQQEENTFYLKLSEHDRKDELDHLFDTNKEASTLAALDTRLRTLNRINAQLERLIDGHIVEDPSERVIEYSKLVMKSDMQFDSVDPFNRVEIENIDETFAGMRRNLVDIQAFLEKFDSEEYKKNTDKQKLLRLSENSKLHRYIVLKNFTENDTYEKLLQRRNLETISRKDSFQKYYLLQRFFNDEWFSKAKADTKFYDQYESFLRGDQRPITVEDKLERLAKWTQALTSEQLAEVLDFIDRLAKLKKNLTQAEGAVGELSELRDGLKMAFQKSGLQHKGNEEKCECPFCGYDWGNYERMLKSVDAKAVYFAEYKKEQVKEVALLKEVIINTFLMPLEVSFESYIESHKKTYNFLSFLNRIKHGLDDNNYADYADRLKASQPATASLIWSDMKSSDQLKSDLEKLISILETHQIIDERVFKQLNELRGYSYEKAIKELEDLRVEALISWSGSLKGYDELEEAASVIFRQINVAASNIKIDVEKLGGSFSHFYKSYFLENEDALDAGKKIIDSKISYLEWKYQQKKYASYDILIKRKDKLEKVIKAVDEVKKSYDNILKKYKSEMIERIRIPFYIYSAKIMQNYQQGIGVFISPSETKSGAIRFLTESESDHDVVHHLSSGQLAVVSIAFTLAINKVYGSSSLKLLAIDDPVHELDTLNVHSFVELLRHGFLDDYQLIISTHDQQSARYMEYKFEKIKPDHVRAYNIQKIFFSTTTE